MMSKKLTNNGLWESSRMMLPEHKLRIQEASQVLGKLALPELDEQEQEEIGRQLAAAVSGGTPVELVIYGEYGHRSLRGRIEKTDYLSGRVQLSGEWIRVRDILGVRE
ncbi:YolD-like family protein [Paenibacillus hexagrammi]|uniref:YolD-like family protein n=1 Tax=Paenibacillus hexagrammi TaxID=2908839 RepID=A0ABY3SE08_9BACL|nr:YolD-like family protein [Paenibacillus sp. YPD9-1]UJF32156.1 YolD-like family protein [Paenibacillus sp. YPD9-1]